jgi:hypothetical protein
MMAGTLRADGRESTSLGIGTGPGSPVPASLPAGPLAGMKVSLRWKGECSAVAGEGFATTGTHRHGRQAHSTHPESPCSLKSLTWEPSSHLSPREPGSPTELSVALPIPNGSWIV